LFIDPHQHLLDRSVERCVMGEPATKCCRPPQLRFRPLIGPPRLFELGLADLDSIIFA